MSCLRRACRAALGVVIGLASAAAAARADTFTFGVLGDAGFRAGSSHDPRDARDSLLRSGVTHLILPGDNIYDPGWTYDQVWGPWLDAGFSFDVVAIGNHTLGYPQEVDYFDMPGEYYKKEYGSDLLFVVLNSDNTGNAAEQAAWFDATMAAATQKIVLVVFHHSTYTLSQRHAWDERRAFHDAIRPLLWRHRSKIDALLIGHDHIASLVAYDDLPVIVSGAGAEQLTADRQDYVAPDGHHVQTKWMYAGGPQWTRLDIDTEAETIWVNFVRANPEGVSCSVRVAPAPWLVRDNCG